MRQGFTFGILLIMMTAGFVRSQDAVIGGGGGFEGGIVTPVCQDFNADLHVSGVDGEIVLTVERDATGKSSNTLLTSTR